MSQKGPPSSSAAPDGATPPARPYQVLVVDDDPNMLLAIGVALTRAPDLPCHVVPEKDPVAALAWADHEQIDIVISDYQMPGTNGLEVLREFKEKRPSVLRVLLTAHSTEELALEAVKGSLAQSYLEKPIDARTLVAVLQEVIARRDAMELDDRLGEGAAESALRLINDFRKHVRHTALGSAEVSLKLKFASPLDLNTFVSRLPPDQVSRGMSVRYADRRFVVELTIPPEDGRAAGPGA